MSIAEMKDNLDDIDVGLEFVWPVGLSTKIARQIVAEHMPA